MDGNVTARFYDVLRDSDNSPTLREVLEGIKAIDLKDRSANLEQDFRVRLERIDADGANVLAGEFTREQTTNLPSEVHPDGLKPLSIEEPLGHGIAFRFNHNKSVLALQFDVRVLGPGKILEYLTAQDAQAKFRLRPIMKKDMWDRFNRGPSKTISITIASPATLPNLEDEAESVADSARRLGAAYEAPEITIELNVGRRNHRLSESVKKMASAFMEKAAVGEIDLRKLRARTDQGAGKSTDEIDLLSEMLSVKERLELPDKNPDKSYEIRKGFLKQAMNKHV